MAVSVIIPAYRAADSIAATVAAARTLPGVTEVVVVDDGSGEGTSEEARRAGADQVITFSRNRGKGAALWAGVQTARGETLLFLDADLGDTAANAAPLLEAVAGRNAMSIAVLPARQRTGGFGFAKGLSAAAIRLLSGLRMQAPMSGQRALPADLIRHLGLGSRWSIETALTIEAAHLGVPLLEVPVALDHHHTGRTRSGFRHRFGQFWDILKYLLLVGYGLGWTGMSRGRIALRTALWLAGFAALIGLNRMAGPLAAVGAALTLGVSLLGWPLVLWGIARAKMQRENYLGRTLPTGAGALLPCVAPMFIFWMLAYPSAPSRSTPIAMATAFAFGLVGVLDDRYGHLGRARGLRGHFRALLRGRITTGAVKAIGGLLAGLAAGYLLERGRPAPTILDALVIALTANLLNLLDLRPGRALKGFLALVAVCSVLDVGSLRLFGPILAAALVLAPADLAGRVMLGDVGANTLGGIAGLALVLALPPLGRLVALAFLVAIHIYCERASLTDLIARNRVLHWLDRLGTEGRPPLPVKEPVP